MISKGLINACGYLIYTVATDTYDLKFVTTVDTPNPVSFTVGILSGGTVTYDWGDGSETETISGDGGLETTTHSFSPSGAGYNIKLTFSDKSDIYKLDIGDQELSATFPTLVGYSIDTVIDFSNNQLTGNLTSLASLSGSTYDFSNNLLTGTIGGFGFYTGWGGTLNLSDNDLSVSAVNAILIAADTSEGENGILLLSGNNIPTSTGLTAKTSLEGKGWIIIVDEYSGYTPPAANNIEFVMTTTYTPPAGNNIEFVILGEE